MKREQPPEKAHLHGDMDVTLERLNQFAGETRAVQVKVLAVLQSRTVENNIELALFAIIFPIAVTLSGFFVSVRPLPGPAWIASISIGVAIFVLCAPLVLLLGVPAWRSHVIRQRSIVWLAAYEGELARMNAQRGRVARLWRATH